MQHITEVLLRAFQTATRLFVSTKLHLSHYFNNYLCFLFLCFCFCPQLHTDTSNQNLGTTVFTSKYKRQLLYYVCVLCVSVIIQDDYLNATKDCTVFICTLFCGMYTCLHRFLEPHCFFQFVNPVDKRLKQWERKM